MNISRRNFLLGAAASVAAVGKGAGSADQSPQFDENLVVLISDMHVWHRKESHQQGELRRTVADILKLRPLPRNVVSFGDLAWGCGDPGDYEAARAILQPLYDADIKVTLGMGNHDRRASFLQYFPEYEQTTKVPGRIVSLVETPHVDILLLDSLQGELVGKEGPVAGALDPEQRKWALDFARAHQKPLIVGAHHPLDETKIAWQLVECPKVLGYIYGHNHRWNPGWFHPNYQDRRVMRTLCLPSSGHWGDIGLVLLRLEPDRAVADLQIRDFYFPRPAKTPSEALSAWKAMVEDIRGHKCTFYFPVR